MTPKYNLSPTEKLNYVQKGKSKGQHNQVMQQATISFLILSILVLILIPYYNNNKKRKDLEREINLMKENISRYENSNAELEELLSYLDSKQAIEEKARLNFGLQKQGEQVIVIQKQSSSTDQELAEKNTEVELSNPQKWLNYFFN